MDKMALSISSYIVFVKTMEPVAAIGAIEEDAPVAMDTGHVALVGTLEDFKASMA
jgi:hypothetical protein